MALLGMVLRLLPQVRVCLIPDDTLCRHTGKKVALGSTHAGPLLKQKPRPFMSCGHVFVVVSVYIEVPWLAATRGGARPLVEAD